MTKDRHFDEEYKVNVALDALKGDKTIAQLAFEFDLPQSQIKAWRNQLKEGIACVFKGNASKIIREKEEIIERLQNILDQLKRERDWLKKITRLSSADNRVTIVQDDDVHITTYRHESY